MTMCGICKDYAQQPAFPVWQCPSCKTVMITEQFSLTDGTRRGWREEMEWEFGKNFKYVVLEGF